MKQFKFVILLFSFLIFSSSQSYAGKIEDTFKSGIFGIEWGSSQEMVQNSFPKGKLDKSLGILQYTVEDSRTIFEILREEDNYIKFFFDSDNELNGVAIEFPYNGVSDFGSLLTKLKTLFGDYPSGGGVHGAVMVNWAPDNGVQISLTQIPGMFSGGDLVFSVGYTSPVKHEATKAQMGLD